MKGLLRDVLKEQQQNMEEAVSDRAKQWERESKGLEIAWTEVQKHKKLNFAKGMEAKQGWQKWQNL